MITARQEIEDMTRQLLCDRLAQCTEYQNERFNAIFPNGVEGIDADDLPGVIDLVNRTIKKSTAEDIQDTT